MIPHAWRHPAVATFLAALMMQGTAWAAPLMIHASGTVLDNTNGTSGTVDSTGQVEFVVNSTTPTTQSGALSGTEKETYGGTLVGPTNCDPIGCLIPILVIKILAWWPSTAEDPKTFAELTGGLFNGTAAVNSPLFDFSGTFTRTPTHFDLLYDLTVHSGFPGFDGGFSWVGVTEPGGPGTATASADILAATPLGDRRFAMDAALSFDPLVAPNSSETNIGSCKLSKSTDTATFDCTTLIQIPEPATGPLMASGLLLLGGACKKKTGRKTARAC